jgi:hypothetical protein
MDMNEGHILAEEQKLRVDLQEGEIGTNKTVK